MPFLRTLTFHPIEGDPGSPLREGTQRIEANTLGEAVLAAAALLSVTIVPHDPPKFFRVYGWPGEPADYYSLVDIHVRRGTENICLKQDLSFPLLDSDTVLIGALAC